MVQTLLSKPQVTPQETYYYKPTQGFIILPTNTTPSPEQVNYLNGRFGKGNWSSLNIPVGGWTLSAMREITRDLKGSEGVAVFATPVDMLMRMFVIHGVSMVMFEEALFG